MKIFYFVYKDNSNENIIEKYKDYFINVNLDDVKLITYDRIQEFLSNDMKSIDCDSLFLIPAVLDSFNAYSYDGVELALRIYFYHVINRRGNFRITILGTEDKAAFWEHCRYSNILKCPHVDFTNNNIFAIKEYLSNLKSINPIIDWDTCIENLKRLNIQPPASYKSHHSITNEWCIYRWSKYLGIENIAIQKEIEEFLYFNYLKAIYPESDTFNKDSFVFLQKGKILLIDDEADKGWHDFFKYLCVGPHITFDSIGCNFKKLKSEEIINISKCKVESYKPDVVILDLRLHDKDYDVNSPDELTGSKIFRNIKEFNKGIQIIIFSASNKVWNYLPFASDGIIIKEAPEISMQSNYTQESILNLRRTLNNCLDRKYLKDIYTSIKDLKTQLDSSDFHTEINNQFDVAYMLISKAETDEQYAFAYVSLYQIIEFITSEYIIREEIVQQDANMLKDFADDSESIENTEVLQPINSKVYRWKFKKNGVYLNDYSFDHGAKTYICNSVFETNNDKTPCPQWKQMAGLIYQEWNCSGQKSDNLVKDLYKLIEKRNGFIHNDKSILDKQNEYDKYLHHDIYEKSGFIKLFETIKEICDKIL